MRPYAMRQDVARARSEIVRPPAMADPAADPPATTAPAVLGGHDLSRITIVGSTPATQVQRQGSRGAVGGNVCGGVLGGSGRDRDALEASNAKDAADSGTEHEGVAILGSVDVNRRRGRRVRLTTAS